MKKTVCVILMAALLHGCGRKLPGTEEFVMPVIESVVVEGVTENSAVVMASVDNGSQVREQGFKFRKDGSSTAYDVQAKLDGKIFSATLSGLEAGCLYLCEAYVGDGADRMIKSREISFSTLPSEPEDPGNTDDPGGPDDPGNTDDPGGPDDPGNTDNPGNSDDPGGSGNTDDPGNTDNPGDGEYVDIPDETFRAWILWRFDSNKDGKIDKGEASKIEHIELSTENISDLTGIESFPNLAYLDAQGTSDAMRGKLTRVDLSHNPKLTHIHLIYNNISDLTLGSHPSLGYLDLDYNDIASLDVTGFKELMLLQVSHNRIPEIDVRGLDNLGEFHIDYNPCETISLSNKALHSFRCAGTLVSGLDFSSCPAINNIDCSKCPHLGVIWFAPGQVPGNITCDSNVEIKYHE